MWSLKFFFVRIDEELKFIIHPLSVCLSLQVCLQLTNAGVGAHYKHGKVGAVAG